LLLEVEEVLQEEALAQVDLEQIIHHQIQVV
jgi:hypothetical protein